MSRHIEFTTVEGFKYWLPYHAVELCNLADEGHEHIFLRNVYSKQEYYVSKEEFDSIRVTMFGARQRGGELSESYEAWTVGDGGGDEEVTERRRAPNSDADEGAS